MPQSTIAAEREAQAAAESRRSGHEEVDDILSRFAALGLGASVRRIGAKYTTTGVTARVALDGLFAPPEGLDRGLSVVYAALRAGIPVTVTIVDPGARAASGGLAYFRAKFCDFLDAASVDRDLLGLCLSAAEIPSSTFRANIRPSLGDGPRYLMLQPGSGRECQSAAELGAVWRLLQQAETNGPRFWPVFPAGVRSRCPLLSGECSSVVLPEIGLVAPAASAWLPIDLDICRFADADGNVCHRRLDLALDACVHLGDRLIDRLSWFDDGQRCDARRNRRLAVFLTGLGDLVERRREQPSDLRCLRALDQLVAGIHEGLWHRSRRIAEIRGPLPALAEKQPGADWRDETHRRDWQARWFKALASVQVRHRNLLAMSPYSVLPRTGTATADYADLLPVLAHADAFGFAGPPSLAHWNISDFKSFHQRVQALVERRNAASFVAAGV